MAFLTAAAAAGASKLGSELPAIVALEATYGHDALVAALERATTTPAFPSPTCGPSSMRTGVPRLTSVGEPLSAIFPQFRRGRCRPTGSESCHEAA